MAWFGKKGSSSNGDIGSLPISRRGVVLIGLQLGLAGTLAWRMRQLQVVEAERYRLLADENRINMRLIAPARAELFDRNGEPVAAIFNSIAPDGYSGRIHMLIGVYADGRIAGVRVVKHAETPGLGDGIEIRKSDWVTGFDGKSLDNPQDAGWRVKRDGGEFDQFTGATITPRAVVAAVQRTLLYYRQNADMIFRQS